jgi:type IV pilus assembly protein PilN
MRIAINLASKPFVELRPLLARLRLAMIALALAAVGLVFAVSHVSQQAEEASAEMNALKSQTMDVQQKTAANERRMRLPQNQSVLERSQFLNALFARKGFSWTAVMMDLERVMPGGVQVTSIDPEISKTGEVTIRLRITGNRDKAIQFVKNLEQSKRFVDPRLGGEMALAADKAKALGAANFQNVNAEAGQGFGNAVEFEVFSGYNPLPEKQGRRDQGSGKSPASGGGAK